MKKRRKNKNMNRLKEKIFYLKKPEFNNKTVIIPININKIINIIISLI